MIHLQHDKKYLTKYVFFVVFKSVLAHLTFKMTDFQEKNGLYQSQLWNSYSNDHMKTCNITSLIICCGIMIIRRINLWDFIVEVASVSFKRNNCFKPTIGS